MHVRGGTRYGVRFFSNDPKMSRVGAFESCDLSASLEKRMKSFEDVLADIWRYKVEKCTKNAVFWHNFGKIPSLQNWLKC